MKRRSPQRLLFLAHCANGCDAPPQPPSLVLCAECLKRLDAKLEAWAKELRGRAESI